MTLFFLVVGLEAKRQLDLGELRERRRLAIPVVAAIGGITVPVVIYLAFNAGGSGAHGWGAAMSTDTAFALAAAVAHHIGASHLRRLHQLRLHRQAVDDSLTPQSAPIANRCLYDRERCHRGGIGAENPRSKRNADHIRQLE